jgi:hypothetical protein
MKFQIKINCPYVVRFRAEHSQLKMICKIINLCGNALPLQLLLSFSRFTNKKQKKKLA